MLPETVAAKAAGSRVSVARLFEFQFASRTMRFWNGVGYLTAGGERWQGSGKIIAASGLEQSVDLSAPQASFTLTGASPELMGYAADSAAEVTGRPCAVFEQFLTGPYRPLDNPIPIWAGVMDVLSFRASIRERVITLTAETLFVDRTRAPYGYMTDTDQQVRWPGDRGFEFTPQLLNKTVTWLRG